MTLWNRPSVIIDRFQIKTFQLYRDSTHIPGLEKPQRSIKIWPHTQTPHTYVHRGYRICMSQWKITHPPGFKYAASHLTALCCDLSRRRQCAFIIYDINNARRGNNDPRRPTVYSCKAHTYGRILLYSNIAQSRAIGSKIYDLQNYTVSWKKKKTKVIHFVTCTCVYKSRQLTQC